MESEWVYIRWQKQWRQAKSSRTLEKYSETLRTVLRLPLKSTLCLGFTCKNIAHTRYGSIHKNVKIKIIFYGRLLKETFSFLVPKPSTQICIYCVLLFVLTVSRYYLKIFTPRRCEWKRGERKAAAVGLELVQKRLWQLPSIIYLPFLFPDITLSYFCSKWTPLCFILHA